MDEKIKRRPKKGESKVDLCKAINLRQRGISNLDIARLMGVREGSISYHFKKLDSLFKEHPEIIKLYDDNKSDFFKAIQMTIGIEMLDPKKLNKASINNLAYAIRQMWDIERVESGKPNQFIAYADALKARDQHKMDLDKLREIHRLRHGEIENQGEVVN